MSGFDNIRPEGLSPAQVGVIGTATPKLQDPHVLFDQNFAIIKQRFPKVAAILTSVKVHSSRIEVVATEEGSVIHLDNTCLDHPNMPRTSADIWIKRVLAEERYRKSMSLLVYGFGSGYHIESLLQNSSAAIIVVEPSIDSFLTALSLSDLTQVLSKINDLVVGQEHYPQNLPDTVDLLIRPQTQACAPDHCNQIKKISYAKRGFSSLHPKIGILGPLHGGTLPIAGYCARSFYNLKQLTRQMDVSGFDSGLKQIEKFIRKEQVRGVVEGHYVQMLSHVLLESLNEHPVDILVCMAQAPVSGALLQELRRRGVVTVLWFAEDYLRFTYWKEMAKYYDFIFTIQKGECIDALRAAGASNVHYLPLAADPLVHVPLQLSKEDQERWGSPLSFVGAGYHNRQHVFASLVEYPIKLWGTEWPECKPFTDLVQEGGRRLTPEEYIKIFNATQININLHSSSERNDVDPFGDFVNPRTFELAACGAFQLVDERSLLSEHFEPGTEVATFKNSSDLKDKIDYYLKNPEERNQIAKRGQERVLRDHTYDQRLKEMLSIIYGAKYEHLSRQQQLNPWNMMLQRTSKHTELHARAEAAHSRGELPKLDGLIADIMNGKGSLTDTEKKLLFLHHVSTQIINIKREERGGK